MMPAMQVDSIAEEYVRLALAIGQHLPDYIDAYIGPLEFKDEAEGRGKQPVPDLMRRAEALTRVVEGEAGLDEQRKEYLTKQTRAMQGCLRRLDGEVLPLAQEAELIYDIHAARTDEADLRLVHDELDDLLPAGGSLYERMMRRKEALTIPMDKAQDVLPMLVERLREAARNRFPLPAEESVDFVYVSGQPWVANNRYLGGGRSRVEISADLPMLLTRLVNIAAHEAYPGHHTEFCIKEARLVREAGRLEHSVVLLYSPAIVVSEGIATSAMSVVMPDESLDEWYAQEILPRVGLDPALARGCTRIGELLDLLGNASENAAFMLHEDGAGRDEVVAYLKQYELLTAEEAGKMVDFLCDPADRTYYFSYGAGQKLLSTLFARRGDGTGWFTRLLSEPVTPSQIRGWIEAQALDIEQVRTRRRTLAIIVEDDGRVIVRAPLRLKQQAIDEFVRARESWIVAKRAQALERASRFVPKSYVSGEEFLYLGESYPLHIEERQRPPLVLNGGFRLSRAALPRAEAVFERWYRRQALKVIAARAEAYAAAHGLAFNRIRVTAARKRWGSCGHNGNLSFAWRLVMAPPPVVDYVVVHELAHLKHRNHSKRFWNKVASMLPEYREREKWLGEHGDLLRLS